MLVVGPQPGERLVLGLRRALAVVARDLGDDLDLAVGEAGELLAVADHVVRVQVVLRVRDEEPDVREQRGRLEVLARRFVEPVHRSRSRRTARARAERPRASGQGRSSHCSMRCSTLARERSRRWCNVPPRERCTVSSSTPSRSAFSRDDELVGVVHVHHLLEDDRAAEDDVGPARIEAGERLALVDGVDAQQRADDVVELVASELEVVERDRRRLASPVRRGHLGDRHDRARAADEHVEAEARAPRARTARAPTARTGGTRRPRPGCTRSPPKKRAVRRIAPSLRLRAASTSPRSPMRSSVEPPPMSTSMSRLSKTGTACSTPRWMRRASSIPEMTSTSTPASSWARRTNTSWFSASRTALVATARIEAPSASATRRM